MCQPNRLRVVSLGRRGVTKYQQSSSLLSKAPGQGNKEQEWDQEEEHKEERGVDLLPPAATFVVPAALACNNIEAKPAPLPQEFTLASILTALEGNTLYLRPNTEKIKGITFNTTVHEKKKKRSKAEFFQLLATHPQVAPLEDLIPDPESSSLMKHCFFIQCRAPPSPNKLALAEAQYHQNSVNQWMKCLFAIFSKKHMNYSLATSFDHPGGFQAYWKKNFAITGEHRKSYSKLPNKAQFDPKWFTKQWETVRNPKNPIDPFNNIEHYIWCAMENIMTKWATRGFKEPVSLVKEDFVTGLIQEGGFAGIPFVQLKKNYSGQKNCALSLKHDVIDEENTQKRTLPCPYSSDALSTYQTTIKLLSMDLQEACVQEINQGKCVLFFGLKSVQYDKLYEGLKIVTGKKNSNVKTTLINMESLSKGDFLPVIPSPSDYTVMGTRGEEVIDPDKKRLLEELWVKKGEKSAKKYDQYVEDLKGLFSTAKGQLSPEVKRHLKTNESWTTVEDDQGTLNMLKLLREYSCYRDSATKLHLMVEAANTIYKFFSCQQDNNKSAATYAREVRARFDVITSAGITISSEDMNKLALKKGFPGKSYTNYTKMDEKNKLKVKTMIKEMLLSVMIVNWSNTKTHRNLSGVLKDNYSLGCDVYPTSQPKARELTNQYKSVTKITTGQAKNSGASGQNGARSGTGNSAKGNKGRDTPDGTTLGTKWVEIDPKTSDSKVADAHQILVAGVEDGAFDDELCFVELSHIIEARETGPPL
eukprot:jgi/Psemu1/36209/gm1.36209_g